MVQRVSDGGSTQDTPNKRGFVKINFLNTNSLKLFTGNAPTQKSLVTYDSNGRISGYVEDESINVKETGYYTPGNYYFRDDTDWNDYLTPRPGMMEPEAYVLWGLKDSDKNFVDATATGIADDSETEYNSTVGNGVFKNNGYWDYEKWSKKHNEDGDYDYYDTDGRIQLNRSPRSISLPNATYIGKNAFYKCRDLTSVNLPKVKTVKAGAFLGCDKLTVIELPEVTSIGVNAFKGCTSLIKLVVSKQAKPFISNSGIPANCQVEFVGEEGSSGRGGVWHCEQWGTYVALDENTWVLKDNENDIIVWNAETNRWINIFNGEGYPCDSESSYDAYEFTMEGGNVKLTWYEKEEYIGSRSGVWYADFGGFGPETFVPAGYNTWNCIAASDFTSFILRWNSDSEQWELHQGNFSDEIMILAGEYDSEEIGGGEGMPGPWRWYASINDSPATPEEPEEPESPGLPFLEYDEDRYIIGLKQDSSLNDFANGRWELKSENQDIIDDYARGVKYTKDANENAVYPFQGSTVLKSISLPNATYISSWSFGGCTSLESVKLNGLINCADNLSFAFQDCTALKHVELKNLETGSDGIFCGCTSLQEITLEKINYVRSNTFAGCTSLRTVRLPLATAMGSYAFGGDQRDYYPIAGNVSDVYFDSIDINTTEITSRWMLDRINDEYGLNSGCTVHLKNDTIVINGGYVEDSPYDPDTKGGQWYDYPESSMVYNYSTETKTWLGYNTSQNKPATYDYIAWEYNPQKKKYMWVDHYNGTLYWDTTNADFNATSVDFGGYPCRWRTMEQPA